MQPFCTPIIFKIKARGGRTPNPARSSPTAPANTVRFFLFSFACDRSAAARTLEQTQTEEESNGDTSHRQHDGNKAGHPGGDRKNQRFRIGRNSGENGGNVCIRRNVQKLHSAKNHHRNRHFKHSFT
nr:MAG TPA: hypothetical protein [Inoviridae sp.]